MKMMILRSVQSPSDACISNYTSSKSPHQITDSHLSFYGMFLLLFCLIGLNDVNDGRVDLVSRFQTPDEVEVIESHHEVALHNVRHGGLDVVDVCKTVVADV